jgi:hypothetical protein
MIRQNEYKLRTTSDTHYVRVAGSCDYADEERCSGGAYFMQLNDKTIESYAISDDHTTEFRMILSVMIHAMQILPADSDIVFLTNVSYIQQNWDRHPTDRSANTDLISKCLSEKKRHHSAMVKLVPFHKYHLLPMTHELAHEIMKKHRKKLQTII